MAGTLDKHRRPDGKGPFTTDGHKPFPDLSIYATKADLQAVIDRVAALEGPVEPPPPATGPTISALTASAITQSGATVGWTLSEKATGQVDYGTTTAYGKQTTAETSLNFSAHSQTITGLAAGTVYHFRVRSTNAAGIESASPDSTFTTVASVPGPTPPPPTGTRPWPAAAVTKTAQILPSIDATGNADVTTDLRNFINSVGSGTTVLGAGPGATYKVSGSVLLGVPGVSSPIKGKHDIAFDGQGATINNVSGLFGSTASNEHSTFYWSWLDKPFPTDLAFRNWVNKGARPTTGGVVKLVGSEFAAFAHIMGGVRIEVDHISGQGIWGDLVTLNENAQQIWVHDCNPTDVGRNNVSVVYASHVLVEDNKFGKSGYCAFDVEPEPTQGGGITDVIYRRNQSGQWQNCYIALDGANSGKPLSDFVFDDNTSVSGSLLSVIGYSLGTPGARPQRISFQRNHGPAGSLKFSHIDGLTVKGNDGAVQTIDCTGVVTT